MIFNNLLQIILLNKFILIAKDFKLNLLLIDMADKENKKFSNLPISGRR